MQIALALIILLPLLGGLLNTLVGSRLPRRVSEIMACGVIWASFGAAVAATFQYRQPVTFQAATWLSAFDFQAPFTLYLDPLSLSLCLMITFVCGLIHLYSVAYMADDPCYVRYFALLNLFVAAMLALVLAESLPMLYLGWEGVGFCSYALIGFWYSEEKNATAGRKAFIVTRIGDTAFAIAIIWLFQLTGSVSITHLNQTGATLPASTVTALGLLLLIGAMGKSAQLPLSVWLPDAMAGPTPVSAQIHAATMVTAGVYLLMRMFPLIGSSGTVLAAIALTGGLTALYAATCAVAQRDLKRVLAYSTISQIGYMMLGVGAGAITAASFHLIVHAFFKALLFLGAGCVITALHHEQDIFKMGGLRQNLPATFWSFLAGALCLAGLPLTGGFFSKDGILAAVWLKGGSLYLLLYGIGLFTAFLTAFYTFRMVYLVFFGNGPKPHRLAALMELSLIPLALLGLCGGLLNLPEYLGHGLLVRFFAVLAPEGHAVLAISTELILQGIAALVALSGLGLAHYRYSGRQRELRMLETAQPATGLTAFLLHGWYLDNLYALLFIRPYRWLSQTLWKRFDEGMIDASLDRLAALLGSIGQRLGSWGAGRISHYIFSLAAGAALIIAWLAWGTP